MLNQYPIAPTIPVVDMARAREFYENKLGFKVKKDRMPAGVMFEAGQGTGFFLYQRSPSKADHTLAGIEVDNLEKVVDELTQKGIVFEKYDFPQLKTDGKGIATMGPEKAAWFKDTEGNIIGISQSTA